MAEESNRNILFGLVQTSIEISLGAAHKSLEMARNPQESASKVVTEMKSMLTVPAHAGPEFQNQAQAMVSVWLEKGIGLLSDLKTTGEKFTTGK